MVQCCNNDLCNDGCHPTITAPNTTTTTHSFGDPILCFKNCVHGTCKSMSGVFRCVCMDGYHGDKCQLNTQTSSEVSGTYSCHSRNCGRILIILKDMSKTPYLPYFVSSYLHLLSFMFSISLLVCLICFA